jgi:ribosomal-protein-alanine N-acetyltransferase
MNTGPMAFMRGLTFPGGQQPIIKGGGVYLRYPRIADFPAWARLRGESRAFLSPWEPVWASDELTKGAFRRRIKRYQKEARLDSAYAFFVFRAEDDVLMGGCTLSNVRRGVTQCCALGYWIGERFSRQGYMYVDKSFRNRRGTDRRPDGCRLGCHGCARRAGAGRLCQSRCRT